MRKEEVLMMNICLKRRMVAKEEIPISKFGVLVGNEGWHGVNSDMQACDTKCGKFIEYIGKSMVADLKKDLIRRFF